MAPESPGGGSPRYLSGTPTDQAWGFAGPEIGIWCLAWVRLGGSFPGQMLSVCIFYEK